MTSDHHAESVWMVAAASPLWRRGLHSPALLAPLRGPVNKVHLAEARLRPIRGMQGERRPASTARAPCMPPGIHTASPREREGPRAPLQRKTHDPSGGGARDEVRRVAVRACRPGRGATLLKGPSKWRRVRRVGLRRRRQLCMCAVATNSGSLETSDPAVQRIPGAGWFQASVFYLPAAKSQIQRWEGRKDAIWGLPLRYRGRRSVAIRKTHDEVLRLWPQHHSRIFETSVAQRKMLRWQ